jgi:hypothetical protein
MYRRAITMLVLPGLAIFLVWRLMRPMNIFIVDERFAWPIDTTQAPEVLGRLSAGECAACHQDFHDEWRTTIHSQAWTDPYFQVDWAFDDARPVCRLCHTPLDRQQPHAVLGYRDRDKWDPILAENPAFDPALQHEGVTCAACHYRDGAIVGVLNTTDAPHPVKQLEDPNLVCVRCHVVEGDRWDTFFRFPPCGTVAEIESTLAERPDRQEQEYLRMLIDKPDSGSGIVADDPVNLPVPTANVSGKTGEIAASGTRALGCVQCHMPLKKRPLVEGGIVRDTRQHLWRGGHDPAMVIQALTIDFAEARPAEQETQVFQLVLTNTGAAHYVPTGTPDRHLTLSLRVLDRAGRVIDEQKQAIKRIVMWRPFIVDLTDNRLMRWQPRRYELEVPNDSEAMTVEAEIRYHLLDESRRRRIGYENKTPIDYAVFHKQIPLHTGMAEAIDE